MTDKNGKDGADPGVMGNLPATRPSRLSRRARAEGDAAGTPAKAAPERPARAKAAPRATTAKTSPRATTAKTSPRATTAKTSPRATTAKSAPRATTAKSSPRATTPRPKAVRAGSPQLRESAQKAGAGRRAAADDVASQQGGGDLAVTVVKAAGELAQIGATVAGQLIKRAAGRLPRP